MELFTLLLISPQVLLGQIRAYSGVPAMLQTVCLVSFCLVAWNLIARRRVRLLTRQIELHHAFSRERDEIVASFGRDESLEAILNRVCAFVERYLAGSSCRIELIRDGNSPAPQQRETSPGAPKSLAITRLPVISSEGKTLALMRVRGHARSQQASQLLDEVAHLTAQAIEQKRLYDRAMRQSPQTMIEGIADRVLLDQRLDAAISRAQVHGHSVALIHVGLESFEEIHELLGQSAGQIVLHAVAFRLLASTRPSDYVARIGRDEFSIILPEIHDREHAEEVARRLVKNLGSPIGIENTTIHVGAAVGVCVFPDQAAGPGEMQRRAHLAMYSAKTGSESAQYSFYGDESEGEECPQDLVV